MCIYLKRKKKKVISGGFASHILLITINFWNNIWLALAGL